MRAMRIWGLCLAAALTLSAAASASAALPEFSGPFPKPFGSKSGKAVLETVKKATVTCAADTNTGQVTGPKAGTVVITFTGCAIPGARCSNTGTPGKIVTNTLVLRLGYISKAKKEVGVDLLNGNLIVEFACGGVVVQVKGSVIGRITPINKPVVPPKGYTLKFTQAGGKQKVQNLEAEPKDTPETAFGGGPFEESGLASNDSVNFAEPTEIKA